MKKLFLLTMLAMLAVMPLAHAHDHDHWHGGVFIGLGGPYYGDPYYPRPYYGYPYSYYAPPVVYAPPPSVVYAAPQTVVVQQGPSVYQPPADFVSMPATQTSPTYQRNGQYCREYQSNVSVGGQPQSSYGTACLQPDGSWRTVQ